MGKHPPPLPPPPPPHTHRHSETLRITLSRTHIPRGGGVWYVLVIMRSQSCNLVRMKSKTDTHTHSETHTVAVTPRPTLFTGAVEKLSTVTPNLCSRTVKVTMIETFLTRASPASQCTCEPVRSTRAHTLPPPKQIKSVHYRFSCST